MRIAQSKLQVILASLLIGCLAMTGCQKEEPVIEEPEIIETPVKPEIEEVKEDIPELIIEDPRDSMTEADLVRENNNGFVVNAIPKESETAIGTAYDYITISQYQILKALDMIEASGFGNKNVSPMSLDILLGLAANGAIEDNLKSYEKFIGIDLETLNPLINKLIDEYNNSEKTNSYSRLANSIWVSDKAGELNSDFSKIVTENLKAEIKIADLTNQETTGAINKWADEKTNGLIKKIANEPFGEEVQSVMYNALYFNGLWDDKFEYKEKSNLREFRGGDGHVLYIPFMVETNSNAKYFKTDYAEAFMKDYKPSTSNTEYCFIGILPNESRLETRGNIEITSEEIVELMNTPGECTSLTLEIPRFSMDCEFDLTDYVSSQGDLSMILDKVIDGKPLEVSKIHQLTSIKFNENGREAAAITGGIVNATSAIDAESFPVKLTFDRPFYYMVIDKTNGQILFAGRVTQPTDSPVTIKNETDSNENSNKPTAEEIKAASEAEDAISEKIAEQAMGK